MLYIGVLLVTVVFEHAWLRYLMIPPHISKH